MGSRMALGAYRVPVVAFAALLGLFLIAPFAVLLATSWTDGEFLTFPPQGFSLRWYTGLFGDTEWMGAFWTSIGVAGLATAVATVLAVAAALGLTRLTGAGRIFRSLFVLPMAMPVIAYALGLYDTVNRVPVLDDSLVPLILGLVCLAFPMVFILVSGAISGLDPALRPAAATLGARWPTIVWKVELPLLRGAIAAGALFGFNLAFDEVVLSIFLIPPGTATTLPLQMMNASSEAISPELTAASTLVTLLSLLLLGGANLISRRRGETRKS
ncbi:putative spermidine/putrescine transport system permease protein [Actinocorallia herbida]|uniref:Putative spermidine/putrescine transport system permease protein n=1 Tax=Actinocorallia herbida TaxID=58109 RepID=A0A3N1D6N2_9ACTN|nr:ABC transporter permease subunit [Actinocorallia herbida]ROO89126.1 putative spermidine/putrescine transport system permease protein [Actinocorallia herbida]